MKVNDFISKAKVIQKMKTSYKLGTFMNKTLNGKYQCDCSGLIKAIFWGYPTNGKYQSNNLKDINANTMITHTTKTSTDFSKIQNGAIVWLNGHIGVYIGNGIVIECTPKWNSGVQMSYCNGSSYNNTQKLNSRTWTKWGLFKYVDYTPLVNYFTKCSYTGNSLVDGLKSINVDSSLSNRKKIAKANLIANYTGTSSQNTKLLNLLKQGKLIKP